MLIALIIPCLLLTVDCTPAWGKKKVQKTDDNLPVDFKFTTKFGPEVDETTPQERKNLLSLATFNSVMKYEADPSIPQANKPRKALGLYALPCQRICAHVKNKAEHGLAEHDIGLISQAYLNARKQLPTHIAGLGISCFAMCVTGVLIPFTGPVAPFTAIPGFMISIYMILHIDGPNVVDYCTIRRRIKKYLVKVVGKDAFNELRKIKHYKNENSHLYLEWLAIQQEKLTGVPRIVLSEEEAIEADLEEESEHFSPNEPENCEVPEISTSEQE